jgi:ABC-type branched-subunit amino acid transport system substrate-binding protein
MTGKDKPTDVSRRRYLRGAAVTVGLGATAGCVGTSDDGGDGSGSDGSGSDGSGGDGSGGDGGTTTGTPGDSGPDSVTLGQPAALTGKWDFLQPGITQATNMAIEMINEAGGPLGATVEVKRRDTAVNPQQARSVMTQLVNNDDALAINGLFSSEITPLFDFLVEQETPIVTPWPGSTALDGRGGDKETPEDVSDDEWIWRTTISDTVHTAGAARKLSQEGFSNIGVIHGASQGETSWADGIVSAFESLGGTIATRVEVEEGKSNYQAELDRLFSTDFEAFAVGLAVEDATTLLRNWADAGYGTQPMLEDTLNTDGLAQAVGSDLEGAWSASPTGQGPFYDDFASRFSEYTDAELNAWTAPAYDAVMATALALHRGGEASREAIERNLGPVTRSGGTEVNTFAEGKEALDAGDEINFQGAGTPVDFTGFGNVLGSVAIFEATGSTFETIETIEASELTDAVTEY